LLRALDVARLTAFVAAAQQHHDLFSVQPVINAQARTEGDPQFKYPATD
jgi:hypothetical protein